MLNNNLGHDNKPYEMTDHLEKERKSFLDVFIKVVGYILFIIFAYAGVQSIINQHTMMIYPRNFGYHRSWGNLPSDTKIYILMGKDAVILGYHYLSLAFFFFLKALLLNEKNQAQYILKRIGTFSSFVLSIYFFMKVGIKMGLSNAVTTLVITYSIGFILYILYRAVKNYV